MKLKTIADRTGKQKKPFSTHEIESIYITSLSRSMTG